MKLVSIAIASLGLLTKGSKADFTWQSGISEKNDTDSDDPTQRRFSTVRQMLVSLSCWDYFSQTGNTGNCPIRTRHYYRALREYGCNCYPENFDVEYRNTGEVLWHMGHNGAPIDDVDQACQSSFHQYQCYEKDGCIKGDEFIYHMNAAGELICGPRNDPDYESDQEGFVCELSACQIEKQFAQTVYPILGDPRIFRDDQRPNYQQNEKGGCQKTSGISTSKDQCCGSFPNRRPYDSGESECCSDGSVQIFGFC